MALPLPAKTSIWLLGRLIVRNEAQFIQMRLSMVSSAVDMDSYDGQKTLEVTVILRSSRSSS